MTPDDDEALARLRAALHTIANRTPISGGRLDEISVAASEKRSRPVVTIVSAAAAVAAIAAVSAVVVGAHSDASRAILPSSGGSDSLTPTPVASPIASAVPSAVPSPIASAVAPVASSTTSCVPENYYVIASPSEVAGLTYMLPATPAGYVLYGAWGTISRNLCADSVTWYVEYEPAGGTPGDGTDAIPADGFQGRRRLVERRFLQCAPGCLDTDHRERHPGSRLRQGNQVRLHRLDDERRGDHRRRPTQQRRPRVARPSRRLGGLADPERPTDRRTCQLPSAARQRVRERQRDAEPTASPSPGSAAAATATPSATPTVSATASPSASAG